MLNAIQDTSSGVPSSSPRPYYNGIKYLELIGKYVPKIKKKLKRALLDSRKGNHKKTLRVLREVLSTDPENIDALLLLGFACQLTDDFTRAESIFHKVLGQAPDNIIINDALGKLYYLQNLFDKAVPYFQKVYELAPGNRPNLIRLAKCFYCTNANDAAMAVARKLVNLEDEKPHLSENALRELHVILGDTISKSGRLNRYNGLAQDLKRLFLLDYVNHTALSFAASEHLRGKYSVSGNVEPPIDLEALGNDTLLLNLLNKTVITDPDPTVEGWLVRIRRALLDEFMESGCIGEHEDLACALATHNFINEYLHPISCAEIEIVEKLCGNLEPPPDNHALLVIGLYRPLLAVPGLTGRIDELTGLPETTARLLQGTLKEPMEEKAIAATLPTLGTINDSVSREVQEQYEENPYPRWVNYPPSGKCPYAARVRGVSPDFDIPDTLRQKPLEMLIAGAGTGRHPIAHALQTSDVQVLAIDISRASLAYGKRMADKFGIQNIEFMQADILNLQELNRKFPVIESVGVLHHMEDPEHGWAILRDMLQPCGIMKIGLYSKTARRDVTRIRNHVAEQQIEPTADNIRKYRHQLLNSQLSVEPGNIVHFTDTYSMSGSRDLLFHVQEHQFTIPRIKRALDNLGLRFLGFDIIKPEIRKLFKKQYPRPEDWQDLDKWLAFENQRPAAFASMYIFYCTPHELTSKNSPAQTVIPE